MNYNKTYDAIIQARKQYPILGYCEEHHILPKCLGGTDDKTNLIKLTAREHFICHLLLTKIYFDDKIAYPKMVQAVKMMSVVSPHQKRQFNSRSYDKLRSVGHVNKGKFWINNGVENKYLLFGSQIPVGWKLGMVPRASETYRGYGCKVLGPNHKWFQTRTKNSRKFCCVETGEIFTSQTEAAKKLGISRSGIICDILKGRSKRISGLSFRYV